MKRLFSLVAGLVGLVVIAGCVSGEAPVLTFRDPQFNDRIRADFGPLTPEDGAARPEYGFFKDGSGGGLVNEVFPLAASAPLTSTATLVQAPCLFVGEERNQSGVVGSDELRLVWEVMAKAEITGDADRMKELFNNSNMTLGLCSLSTPDRRLLFDNDDAPLKDFEGSISCHPEAETDGIQLAISTAIDPEENYNIPNRCVRGHPFPEIQLDAVAPHAPDPDATCPNSHFAGEARIVKEGDGAEGWYRDFWSVCGYSPNHVVPKGDASYRLSFKQGNSFSQHPVEHWMSPNVLKVSGKRSLVRPMARIGTGNTHWRWQTRIDQPGGAEAPLRWAENFTSTVQVEAVEVVTRDVLGANEQVLPPNDRKLTISVPRPNLPTASVTCTLKTGASRFAFPGDCTLDDGLLSILTPTYGPAYLNATPPVTTPIGWSADLSNLPGNRTALIRFFLRAKAQPALMRISPIRDFGPIQLGAEHEGALELENVGGQPLRVRSIGFAPGSAHPGDFSFVVAGDPVEVPLPIESVPEPGGFRLRLSADAATEEILTVTQEIDSVKFSLGDPDRGSTPQALDIYGQPARLVGSVLLRDDPAAVFTPAVSAWPRPFTVTAFAEQQPPFLLRPGRKATITVIARPGALGVRSALLRVEAESIAGPATPLQATAVLRADALQGPQLNRTPSRLWFSRTASGSGARRAALIDNVGTHPLDVTRISVQGPQAARFSVQAMHGAPPFALGSGDYDDLWITYVPECDGTYGSATSLADHRATLVVESTGGRVELELSGSSYGFCTPP